MYVFSPNEERAHYGTAEDAANVCKTAGLGRPWQDATIRRGFAFFFLFFFFFFFFTLLLKTPGSESCLFLPLSEHHFLMVAEACVEVLIVREPQGRGFETACVRVEKWIPRHWGHKCWEFATIFACGKCSYQQTI